VTLKLATSLDGKIALANGQSEWITGEAAREQGRELRATHDAIVVGSNTVVLDNPQLTTRIDGKPDPQRVIFDSQLRLSVQSNLAQTANDVPVIVFCTEEAANSEKAKELEALGVRIFAVETYEGGLNPQTALNILWNMGVKTVLLEGGGTLTASFITWELVDYIEWFRAPIILGAEGRPGIGNLLLEDINQIYRFNRMDYQDVGEDMWERYALQPHI
jgi:diaminohydroxyphosphoribosylaminopyrimidine deaminase/5-amino-6-(5-phosphoribosylamino)uracil reductase